MSNVPGKVVRFDNGEVKSGEALSAADQRVGRIEFVGASEEETNAARHVIAAVRVMREAQRAYFAHRSEQNLKQAKTAEAKVDSAIRAYDRLVKPGSADVGEQATLI